VSKRSFRAVPEAVTDQPCPEVDVPMSRVKFNVNTEYGFLQNFKILQSRFTKRSFQGQWDRTSDTDYTLIDCFTKHQIDRPIGVEGLIKCKMQDNLEFLQWTKRYWDQYYPGGDYDAVGRRKGSGPPPAAAPSAPVPRTSGAGAGAGAARRGTTPTTLAAGRIRTPQTGANSAPLIAENNQLKETIVGLERERDFYFSKLRDIELLLQQAVEADPEIEKDNDGLIKHVQAVLYSTEVRTCGSTLIL